jgi:hypothetical protein
LGKRRRDGALVLEGVGEATDVEEPRNTAHTTTTQPSDFCRLQSIETADLMQYNLQ